MTTHTVELIPRNANSNIREIFPASSSVSSFSNQISALSPNFVRIYNQSEKAEAVGLDEICGIGYRKALEFLIKDYAIAFNTEKETDIAKASLSACIETYISDTRIKSLAKASAWIGNDETHYVRLHENYDIKHLKTFISAIVSFIDANLACFEAERLLTSRRNRFFYYFCIIFNQWNTMLCVIFSKKISVKVPVLCHHTYRVFLFPVLYLIFVSMTCTILAESVPLALIILHHLPSIICRLTFEKVLQFSTQESMHL